MNISAFLLWLKAMAGLMLARTAGMAMFLLAVLFLVTCFATPWQAVGPAEENAVQEIRISKLEVREFQGYFPQYIAITNQETVLPTGLARSFSEYRTRHFEVSSNEGENPPYEQRRARIFVFQGPKAECRLDVVGFKNIDVRWITEDILIIETWPGRVVRLITLINVETGSTIYRSAAHCIPRACPNRGRPCGAGLGSMRA